MNPPSTSHHAVHERLRRRYGPAREQVCVAPGCGESADVWAWQRTGPSMRGTNKRGASIVWGTNLADYAPMCYSHSRMLDGRGTLTHCPRGHDRAVAGVHKNGACAQCNRDAVAARKVRA